jgi:hypothetical protein
VVVDRRDVQSDGCGTNKGAGSRLVRFCVLIHQLKNLNQQMYFRTTALWLLRNGACAKFVNSPILHCDYNVMPPENQKFLVKEILAKNAGINSDGFIHIKGCLKLERISLTDCSYITDEALEKLDYRKESLKFLEIINCKNITEDGLRSLKKLTNLQKLVARNLPYVNKPAEIAKELQEHLKNCEIVIE